MNKSKAATDQKTIHNFMEKVKYGLQALDTECGPGDGVPPLVCHNGHTYSITVGKQRITMTLTVEDAK